MKLNKWMKITNFSCLLQIDYLFIALGHRSSHRASQVLMARFDVFENGNV